MICPILQLHNPKLREKSQAVSQIDQGLMHDLWTNMAETLQDIMTRHVFRNSAGISAVQIGVLLRACLVWTPQSGFLHMVNPVVLEESPEREFEFEGCLSFFNKRGLVSRPRRIRVLFQNREFEQSSLTLHGWAARIVLHELDHMDGILYSDRMLPEHQLISYEQYVQILARQ